MIEAQVLKSARTLNIIKVLGGACAMAAAAQISIPIKPVVITFHTLIVMIIGLTYAPALARNAMATYLLAGAAGLPLFFGFNGGLPYIMGPTGGYLAGFFAAACVMPYFQQRYGNGTISTACNCLLGSVIIYALGIAWLGQIIGYEKAFYSGFVVFIPTGIAKILLLVGIMRYIRRL